MAEENKTVEPVVEVPKSKEEWGKLAKEDPVKFAELTQSRMDKIFRENRELQERLAAREEAERNLQAELQRFKTPEQPVQQEQGVVYGNGVYPQTEEEWDNLLIERPSFGHTLLNEFNSRKKVEVNKYIEVWKKTFDTLVNEHPDMYIPELGDDGQPKRDDKGKIVLKLDPTTKEPIFNPNSEKGKVWLEVCEQYTPEQRENIVKTMPDFQLHFMSQMERRLRSKGESMIKGQNNSSEQDSLDVAPKGVPPPKSVPVKFASEDEETYAKRSVARGTFKSLEEWAKYRDQGNRGYTEPNSFPDFTKR